jgi:hypothetical protein
MAVNGVPNVDLLRRLRDELATYIDAGSPRGKGPELRASDHLALLEIVLHLVDARS